MKILLSFLLLFVFIPIVKAQITTPVINANFGVDGDLTSNYFNFAAFPGEDDWFPDGQPGAGEFVIDTTGAAAIVAGYITDPTTTNNPVTRGMNQTIYSVVNNKLLMDANFTRDYYGDDSTVFAVGSNKNAMSPAAWSCPVAQSVPDKNEILDVFTHIRRDGPNPVTSDSLWFFGGLSLENTNGNRYFDFELFQTNLTYSTVTRTFSGYGPDEGHTTWVFDAAGNVVSAGDIILTAEYSSSSLTLIEARIWINKSDLGVTPTAFTWGGAFDGVNSSATYGYASILPKTAGSFYTGMTNSATTTAGPFSLIRVGGILVTDYIVDQFMEFSVNLTELGIDPASYGNGCGIPFRSVLIKTRASTSFTAELKDFVKPFELFNYTQPAATTLLKYFCGTMPATTIDVINPVSTSVYTWSTFDGNIVGPVITNTVTIDAPGTYYVTQQLHNLCAPLGIDSVTILYDSVCTVLNINITNFTVVNKGLDAIISWQASNNELAFKNIVEYSDNGLLFTEVAVLPAIQKTGMAGYVFSQPISLQKSYYRIKIIEKDGTVKYSSTIKLNSEKEAKKIPIIFPNPTQGEAFVSIESSRTTMVSIYLTDMGGRLIKTLKLPVNKGNNLLSLHKLARQTGIYLVTVKSIDGETTQQLIIRK